MLLFRAVTVGPTYLIFPIVSLSPVITILLSVVLLRERTGSLYPGIALHCMNNSLAFGASQHWGWEIPVLFACALALISLVVVTASL